MNSEEKGSDFVNFRLKKDAPEYVAIGKTRFHGAFHRGEEPFRATQGEWKVFIEKTGFFELDSEAQVEASAEARRLNPKS